MSKSFDKEKWLRNGAKYRAWRRLEKAHPEDFNRFFIEEYKKLAERFATFEKITSRENHGI